MVSMTAIGAAAASLNAAMNIAKAMIGLRDGQAFQAQAIEFQSKILEAQSSIFAANEERTALVEQVRELEEQMARMKAWETEKQRYALTDFGTGAFAYLVKPEARGTEPLHCICVACYQQGKKSILQCTISHTGTASFNCPSCKEKFQTFSAYENFPFRSARAID
jgi:hypothetical protein